MWRRPASSSPNQTMLELSAGFPRISSGTRLSFGARTSEIFHFNSSGAPGMNSRQSCNNRVISSRRQYELASNTEVNGCSRTSNSVTTPKFPPPPRNAQQSSEFSPSFARISDPSAVTNLKPTTLSHDSPSRRVSQPVPPPSTRPPAPVCETTPAGNTRPCCCVAVSTLPRRHPPPNFARRETSSTSTLRSRDKSITNPPSQLPKPARLCPPHRTAVRTPASCACRTMS